MIVLSRASQTAFCDGCGYIALPWQAPPILGPAMCVRQAKLRSSEFSNSMLHELRIERRAVLTLQQIGKGLTKALEQAKRSIITGQTIYY